MYEIAFVYILGGVDMDNKAKILANIIDGRGSRKSFAKKIGLPPTTLQSMLVRGVGGASVDNVLKICQALDMTIEHLEELANKISCHEDQSIITISEESGTYTTNYNAIHKDLNHHFMKLNLLGKKEAVKRVEELTLIDKYANKEKSPIEPQAPEKNIEEDIQWDIAKSGLRGKKAKKDFI